MKEFDVKIEVMPYEANVLIEAESAEEAERIAMENEVDDFIDVFIDATEVSDE